jgi:hypothetical protein
VRIHDALQAGPMDDISLSTRTLLSLGEAKRPARKAAAWAGACVLIALTLATLVPPAIYVWLLGSHSGMDGQANHANHVAAAKEAMLMILLPAAGAALGGVAATLARRPVSMSGHVAAMAAGAFMASLMLTAAGFLWLLGHAQFTF